MDDRIFNGNTYGHVKVCQLLEFEEYKLVVR